ncbi:MAG: AraC family transcriptional regulator [Verrucomicrobia bacterium]|nr:AraC family transcriptional regulator [Verrucomicrobiota bacterium]
MDIPAPTEKPAGHWLREAMRCVLRARPANIIGRTGWPAQPMRAKPDPSHHYPLGLHSNNIPEVCIALEGRAILDIEDRRYALRSPCIGVLEPGVRHSEGFARRVSGYRVLWLMISRPSVLVSVIHYRPRKGWDCIEQYVAQTPQGAALFDRLRNMSSPTTPAQFEPFRAEVLATLGVLLHQAVQRAATSHGTVTAINQHEAALSHLREQLDHQFDRLPNVTQLAEMIRVTPDYLDRLFRSWTGKSVHQYHHHRQMHEAMRLCKSGGLLVKEIAHQVGFNDPLYFSRAFHKFHGCSPNDARGTR